MNKPIESAYSLDQWRQLEQAVFDGAGECLTRYRDHARYVRVSPVPFLIACALYSLSATPGRVTFDVGAGAGSPNMFVVLMGAPGSGKDMLMRRVRDAMIVAHNGSRLIPVDGHIGSGEGLLTSLQPESVDGETLEPQSVLVGVSEVSYFEQLASRKSNTLRSNLLSIYSGDSLGVSNRSEKLHIEARSYRMGMWIGAQPDTVGCLIHGDNDGLRQRLIFTEVLDPLRKAKTDYPKVDLLPVEIPSELMRGVPMPFDDSIVQITKERADNRLLYGSVAAGSHTHQTTAKLAMGLALLRSGNKVHADDFKRAQAIMEYSQAVLQGCEEHFQTKRVSEDVDRMERKERAIAEKETRDKVSTILGVLRFIETRGVDRADCGQIRQSLRSDQRKLLTQAIRELENQQAVKSVCAVGDDIFEIVTDRMFERVYQKYQREHPQRLKTLS